jgi:NTP pyrophosphatase (non-canonical NTP hydrolase)
MMDFNTYQHQAHRTAVYPVNEAFVYTALGLVGEAGEYANKVKKTLRRDPMIPGPEAMADELGDVLWYLAECANAIGYSLDDIARVNLLKLQRRYEENTIRGSGDNR